MSLLQKIKQVPKWLPLRGAGVPFIVGYALRSWTSIPAKRYPKPIIMNFCVLHATEGGALGTYAVEEEQYLSSAKYLFTQLPLLEKIFSDFAQDEAEFYRVVNLLKDQASVAEHYQKFTEAYDAMYSSGIMIDGFLVYSETFVAEIKAKYPHALGEIETLIQPWDLHFLQKEHVALLTLALKIKEGKIAEEEKHNLLIDHREQFHWIQNNYKQATGLPVSYFSTELEKLLEKTATDLTTEKNKLEQYTKEHHVRCEEIDAQTVFAVADYERLLWLGKIAWWVDRRKACNLIANYYIDRYAEWVAANYQLKYEDIVLLLPWELAAIVAGEKTMNDFPVTRRREEFSLVYSKEDEFEFFTGTEARATKTLIDPPLSSHDQEVKGMVACRGTATGTVRIIFDPHGNYNFNDGDILVTGMTRPDFVPLMKRAGAVITDEGGITCHAAIVSRELNIPCIIGTKFATKILQDGMMVEVDSAVGTVKIVNPA